MIGDLNADGGSTWGYGGLGLAMTGFGDFIFQAMFAATGATIVSGAVAERVKLSAFMVFAVLFVGVAYPVAGSWHWGGGVLADMGFKDFAGSTVVHAFGGFGASGLRDGPWSSPWEIYRERHQAHSCPQLPACSYWSILY